MAYQEDIGLMAHLMRRAGFGATRDELEARAAKGYEATVEELLQRHRDGFASEEDRHWSVWTCESFLQMCEAAGLTVLDHQDPDDKVGNGFTVVLDAAAP